MKAQFKAVDSGSCVAAYRQSNKLPQGIISELICAGDPSGGKDACQGDSGGPLVYSNGGVWNIVGIVAAGRDCGKFYGLYTRVSAYHQWISSNAV
jgi:secreted trypsin-like serine protease